MNLNRLISVSVFVASLLSAIVLLESKEIFAVLISQIVGLLLIWFPKDVNDFTMGLRTRGGTINTPTPPVMISIFGWAILLISSMAAFDNYF